MLPYPTVRILTLSVLAIGTGLLAQAQESAEPEETPIAIEPAAASGGKTCYVSKVRFTNEGGYALDWFLVNDFHLAGEMLSQGQSRTWKLKKAELEEGEIFHLTYRMDQGNRTKRKSCKKDGTVLKYHPDGNTWSHWSKGTTKYNNRCRYRSSNKCITSVE